jgi:hypothetical protein
MPSGDFPAGSTTVSASADTVVDLPTRRRFCGLKSPTWQRDGQQPLEFEN